MIRAFFDSVSDLLPIILVVAFFQIIILQQPFPNPLEILFGLFTLILGLTFFIQGLNLSLFPVGEELAEAFAKKGNIYWLILFAFALGFGTTIAEPALIVVSAEAAKVMATAGLIEDSVTAQSSYATGLRYTVALSVGISLILGVIRIIKGWPVHWIIISGYVVIVVLTQFAPREIIGIAYDSGGVTTSTITVPLVTALGIGLSSVIKGRNPMVDGFGLIALASLFPIGFVLIYGLLL